MTAGVLLAAAALAWPEPTRDAKPWVYNWWMGSAVDAAGLEYQCTELEKAGFGGFHVIPIYGAKGYEKQWREFLSPAWAEGWSLANAAAARHGLGVDLTMGSGWCFGGPQLTKEQGVRALCVVTNRAALPRGAEILWEGRSLLRPPADHPILLAQCLTGQSVKRAGPGGKGPMMDPFSTDAMDAFIRPYSAFFDQPGVPKPTHLYHDSYEYFKSGWTPALFDAFRAKRGYDLRDHLAELAGVGDREAVCRVKCDYRETLSDLIIEDVFPRWTAWCRARGIRTRNEAHGAPANLLDFYALADVPETEMFGKGDRNILISKFASSAAHVTGKPLVSSESCTWIDEHFNETLAEAKVFLDRLFLAGVNHVYFHGFCYSPVEAVWPGWCFYASLQMNPRNPIWHDVPTLAAYITRCQSVFQTWTPDEDVLVYWPIHDLWWDADGFEKQLTVHRRAWFEEQPIGRLCQTLYDQGYAFDYISDRMLQRAAAGATSATLPHGEPPSGRRSQQAATLPSRYCVLVVPPCRHMPDATAHAIAALEAKGLRVVRDHGRARSPSAPSERAALVAALDAAGAERMPFNASNGLLATRFAKDGTRLHFVANQGKSAKTITSEHPFTVMDPMDGSIRTVISLDLPPGHSAFVCGARGARALPVVAADTPLGRARSPSAPLGRGALPRDRTPIAGPWRLTPACGGPTLPPATNLASLAAWSTFDPAFCGTMCYTTTFDAPSHAITQLDLGDVRESARVRLNGVDLGCRLLPPYTFDIPAGALKPRANKLEVEVTSVGANRIRWNDLYGVKWKYFTDINIVTIDYKKFDASTWPVRENGLLGPVTLVP